LESPAPASGALLPLSILNYVRRSGEAVVLVDAATSPYAADEYVAGHRPRSVLCVPVVRQTKLVGLLYLENNLTTGAFTPETLSVLRLLATQAAISLQNALLYADLRQENSERQRAEETLREREARFRRLVESNIIGVFFWDLHGGISEANDAFLRMVGYDRDDLSSGRIRWTELTPPEHRAIDERKVAELQRAGVAAPYEKEYLRKDGSRLPVLIGGALFDASQEHGVAFVLDLSERKRAEGQLRSSLREKEVLLAEVHHRVKNNLQLISSLLSLQATLVKDASARGVLAESRNRVRSIALVHENLYRAGNFAGVAMGTHVQSVCAQLFRSHDLHSQCIELETSLANLTLDLDQAVPCGLIVNELVSNALRHAFPGGRGGRVRVELRDLGGGQYALVVSDDGVGLPADFDLGRGQSLGMQLVGDLTRQLGGTVALSREGGTTFTITFRSDHGKA
jgi:PAS domain S-box-containing protein